MAGPLEGLRVIDCSQGPAGLRATGILADYGADVVWVEPPGGDPYREELAEWYSVINRGKRSVTVDLPRERDAVLDLLSGADLFVQSWRPGVAARLGLGYEQIHALLPSVVCCSISGFGADGRYREVRGYEAIVHAVLGTMGEQGGFRPAPIYEGVPFATFGASYLALIGSLAALYRRHSDGLGRHVETSLLDGAFVYLTHKWSDVDRGQARKFPGTIRLVCRPFRSADEDEKYVGVHTGALGGWGRFVNLMGLEDRLSATESGLDLGIPLTDEEKLIVNGELPDLFAKRTQQEWMELLAGADIAGTPILRPCESFDEPQVIENGMVVRVDDPVLGIVDQVAPPMKFAATPAVVRVPAPTAGQHTSELRGSEPKVRRVPEVGNHRIDERPLLAGVRILDLGSYHAGPYASRLLADLGADVIKLEPTRGDVERGMPATFRSAQANKRSIAIDLKDSATRQVGSQLARWADIVHHNMRPGVAERLGLGAEQVQEQSPGCIYLHAPGWGDAGPLAMRQSFEPLQSYFVGAAFEAAGTFNPPVMPAGIADPGAGLLSAVGMLMGLVHRQRTGVGQAILSPQLNAAMMHVAHIVRAADGTVLGSGKLDPLQLGVNALDRLYQTSDGWVCLVAKRDKELLALGRAIGVDLLSDERFATYGARAAHNSELEWILESALGDLSTDDALVLLGRAGVAVAVPVLDNRRAFLNDAENFRLGRIVEIPDPEYGHIREQAVLFRVSESEIPPHRLAPLLGQHTEEVLTDLGYSADEIASFLTRGLIAVPESSKVARTEGEPNVPESLQQGKGKLLR
jgi:crotonobetainyl-CoA:carnitine CoA-transferase CaiB-like acyl-CoA transferase